MEIKPYGANLYIEPFKEESIFQVKSDSITEKGTVLAIGDEVKDFKVGDIILFNAFLADRIELDNEKFYFVQENSKVILARCL